MDPWGPTMILGFLQPSLIPTDEEPAGITVKPGQPPRAREWYRTFLAVLFRDHRHISGLTQSERRTILSHLDVLSETTRATTMPIEQIRMNFMICIREAAIARQDRLESWELPPDWGPGIRTYFRDQVTLAVGGILVRPTNIVDMIAAGAEDLDLPRVPLMGEVYWTRQTEEFTVNLKLFRRMGKIHARVVGTHEIGPGPASRILAMVALEHLNIEVHVVDEDLPSVLPILKSRARSLKLVSPVGQIVGILLKPQTFP